LFTYTLTDPFGYYFCDFFVCFVFEFVSFYFISPNKSSIRAVARHSTVSAAP
jgi:hypothetical protein